MSSQISLAKDLCPLLYGALTELNKPIEFGFLSAKDKIKAYEIFEASSLSATEKAEQLFQIVMESRLAMLPKEVAAEVRKVLSHKTIVKTGSFGGAYTPLLNSTKIKIPKELRETMIEYMVLVHETEHAIQSRYIKYLRGYPKVFGQNAEYGFQSEKGAMLAEWNYLSSIPSGLRQQMIGEVEKVPGLAKEPKEFLLRILRNSDKDSTEYLNLEWQANRYGREFFAEAEKMDRQMDRLIKYGLLYPGSAMLLLGNMGWICQKMQTNTLRETMTYKKVCGRFGY